MIWHEICAWLRRKSKQSSECDQAREQALLSRAQAERDWAVAMTRKVEADQVTQALRAHNIANSYDDWLREVVRW